MDSRGGTFERIRRINDELVERAREDVPPGLPVPLVCECTQPGCFHPVWVQVDRYPTLVAAGQRLLAPGHRSLAAVVGEMAVAAG